MKEEVERIKKLVGIDHNRWEQPCTCDKCKNMCKVPCIGTPKDSVLRAVAHEWVKVENFGDIMRVVFKFLHENERRK